MAAAVLDRVPVDRIQAQAKEIHFARTVLTVVVAVLWFVGWVVAKAWGAVAWSVAAVEVGWQDARSSRLPDGGG